MALGKNFKNFFICFSKFFDVPSSEKSPKTVDSYAMASAEESSEVVMADAIEEVAETLPETTATPATSKVADETPVEAASKPEIAGKTPPVEAEDEEETGSPGQIFCFDSAM